jgi:hypothetical protein
VSYRGTAITLAGLAGSPWELDKPLKVGVLFSHFTATGPSRIGRPYGHGTCQTLTEQLIGVGFDLYAVVEPDTGDLAELRSALGKHGLVNRMVDGSDPAALAQLDVIVLRMRYNLRDNVVAAFDTAVRNGVGLVCFGASGHVSSEQNGEGLGILDILGLSSPTYTWAGNNPLFPLVVAEKHPILEPFQVGDLLPINTIDGYTGKVDGTPLMMLPGSLGVNFTPLHVRNYGEGRVVTGGFLDFPAAYEDATPEEFFRSRQQWRDDLHARCCLWAGNQL